MVGSAPTPFATFVKKLQESLTRMESFDVVTVAQGVDGGIGYLVLAAGNTH